MIRSAKYRFDQLAWIVLHLGCVEVGLASRGGGVSLEVPPKNRVGIRIGLTMGHRRTSFEVSPPTA